MILVIFGVVDEKGVKRVSGHVLCCDLGGGYIGVFTL